MAGVVDDHVDSSMLVEGRIDQVLEVATFGHRTLHADHTQLLRQRLSAASIRHERKPITVGLKSSRDGFSHPVARRRHYRYRLFHRSRVGICMW